VNRDLEGVLSSDPYRAGRPACWRAGGCVWRRHCTIPSWQSWPRLPRRSPNLTIILNISAPGADRLVRQPGRTRCCRRGAGHCDRVGLSNVILKLGGVGQHRFGFNWHARAQPDRSEELAAALSPLMQYCIEQSAPTAACSKVISRSTRCRTPTMSCNNAFQRLSTGTTPRRARRLVPRHGRPCLPDSPLTLHARHGRDLHRLHINEGSRRFHGAYKRPIDVPIDPLWVQALHCAICPAIHGGNEPSGCVHPAHPASLTLKGLRHSLWPTRW